MTSDPDGSKTPDAELGAEAPCPVEHDVDGRGIVKKVDRLVGQMVSTVGANVCELRPLVWPAPDGCCPLPVVHVEDEAAGDTVTTEGATVGDPESVTVRRLPTCTEGVEGRGKSVVIKTVESWP